MTHIDDYGRPDNGGIKFDHCVSPNVSATVGGRRGGGGGHRFLGEQLLRFLSSRCTRNACLVGENMRKQNVWLMRGSFLTFACELPRCVG